MPLSYADAPAMAAIDIERRIAEIKRELSRLGPLRPGSLSQQYNVCGTPGCRCKADPPERHGPYSQISYNWKGRSKSEFVREDDLADVCRQLESYNRLRHLVEEWIALGLERARRLREARRGSAKSTENRPRGGRFPGKAPSLGANRPPRHPRKPLRQKA